MTFKLLHRNKLKIIFQSFEKFDLYCQFINSKDAQDPVWICQSLQGMYNLYEDSNSDQREGGLGKETEILNHEVGQVQWIFRQR